MKGDDIKIVWKLIVGHLTIQRYLYPTLFTVATRCPFGHLDSVSANWINKWAPFLFQNRLVKNTVLNCYPYFHQLNTVLSVVNFELHMYFHNGKPVQICNHLPF